MTRAPHPITLESLNLADAERQLCVEALRASKTIRAAAVLLGISRHALQRRIKEHAIDWTWHGPDEE